jgi:transposase
MAPRARPSDSTISRGSRRAARSPVPRSRRCPWRSSVERAAGLDVDTASVTACVRVPAQAGERSEHVETFPTTVPGLLVLADWPAAHAVTQVAMEATGVYCKPVWAVLEERFDCLLVNAHHVKQVPGRKTEVSDAQWICRLAEAGLLRRSLVPPQPIRTLRTLTRYRKAQIRDRQREAGRLHKLMQDTGIKLDCVASDLLGKSGRAMLDALIAGTSDPAALADLAQGKLRAKLPALREGAAGPLRQRPRAARRAHPRPHRLPRRVDRRALRRDRGADRPVHRRR